MVRPCVGRRVIYADELPHHRCARIANVTASSDHGTADGRVTLRYWASARAAAGTDTDDVDVAGPVSLAELVSRARTAHDSRRFADVIACCAVMVGDRPVTTDDPAAVMVQPGDTVEFLPPFAGG
jgi:molybdopterin synthase sulfur carrier subunit